MHTTPRPHPTVLVGAALLLAVWVVPMGLSGTSVALTPMSVDLGADQTRLQWVVNGFNVAFAGCTLVWGAFSDRIGYRRTFRLGVGLYLAAAITSSLAGSLAVIAVARTLAGAAGAAVFTGASSVISTTLTGPSRGRMFACYGATIGLGLACGPSLAGALISVASWRAVYIAHAAVLLVALTGSLVIPRVEAPRERGGRLFEPALLRQSRFLAMCLVAVAGSIAFVTMLTYLPTALSATYNLGDARAGLHMLPLTIPVFCGPFLGERLARRSGPRGAARVVILGVALLCLGLAGMLLLSPDRDAAALLVPALFIGTGFGLSLGLVDAEALAAMPPELSGTAAGVLNFFRMGSEAVFVALYGAAIALGVTAWIDDDADADRVIAGQFSAPGLYAHAFHLAVAVLLACLLLTAVAASALLWAGHHRHGCRPRP